MAEDPKPSASAEPKGSNLPAKVDASDDEEPKREGWLSWAIGWIVVPMAVIGGIFGGGAHYGANHPQGWITRSVVWIADLF